MTILFVDSIHDKSFWIVKTWEKSVIKKYREKGSVEFLLSGDEIKSTYKMKEGAVPVPLTTPALRAMMT